MSKRLNCREQILAGARSCFAGRGYVGATVPELERACGVTRRTLFKHFENKQQLFVAVLAEEAAARARYFGQVAAGFTATTCLRGVLEAVFEAQLQLTRRDPMGFKLRLEFVRMAELDPGIRPEVEALELNQLEWRRGLFDRLIAQGLLHSGWSAAAATDLMSTMLLGLITQQSYGFPTGADALALVPTLAGCLADCLEAPPVDRSDAP